MSESIKIQVLEEQNRLLQMKVKKGMELLGKVIEEHDKAVIQCDYHIHCDVVESARKWMQGEA